MNPAVSLAMMVLGKLPLKKFPVYVVAQFLGAFAGSCAVYGLYYGVCTINVISTLLPELYLVINGKMETSKHLSVNRPV